MKILVLVAIIVGFVLMAKAFKCWFDENGDKRIYVYFGIGLALALIPAVLVCA